MINIAERFGQVTLNPLAKTLGQVSPGDRIGVSGFTAGERYNISINEASTHNGITTLSGEVAESEFGYFIMSAYDGLALAVLQLPLEGKRYVISYNHQLEDY